METTVEALPEVSHLPLPPDHPRVHPRVDAPPPRTQNGMPRSLGICEKLFLRWQMPLDLLALPDLNNNKDNI